MAVLPDLLINQVPIRGVSEKQASLGRSLLSGSMGERKGHLQRNCRHKGTEGLVWLLWEMEQPRALLGEEASEMGLSAGVASVTSPRASVRTALGRMEQGRSLHLTRALELGSELARGHGVILVSGSLSPAPLASVSGLHPHMLIVPGPPGPMSTSV